MESSIILENPDFVREEMRTLDASSKARGEKYFAEGRVRNLRRGKEPGEFLAEVIGTKPYEVHVSIDDEGTVEKSCSCPLERDCKHIYATLKALLVEHTRAHVHALSAMQKTSPAQRAKLIPFDEQVAKELGRAPNPKEKTFLKNLARIYEQCRQRRTITPWDFQEIGLSIGGNGWEGMKIWPTFPDTLRQFWLYVAYAAVQRGALIPDFLQPISDFEEIERELRRWQRMKEIERWKSALGQVHPGQIEASTATAIQRVDLRVSFQERAAVLEWRPDGKETFAAMKAMQTRELQRELREGEAELTPEAEWIWQSFEQKWNLTNRTELEYYQPDALRILARLFRMQPVQSRLVTTCGERMQFVAEPLRWHLDPASDEDDDYLIRLTQADGSPVPPTLFVLPGRPRLYVTAEKVFSGPPLDEHVLDPNSENRIPAPALESQGGVAMLRTFGLEMPPRLRERVQIVPLSIHLTCELRASYAGSNAEVCTIVAQAATPDGRTREEWNGYNWERLGQRAVKEPKKNGVITVHDRQGVGEPLSLLAPLDAKWDTFQRAFSVRLTKKFADNFAAWIKMLPPHINVELKGELASLKENAIAGRVKLDVSEAEIDWFDLRVVLDVTDTTLSQEELKLLLNARGSYVRLKDKGWRRLEFNLTDEEDEQLARLGLSPRELSAEPQRLHALQLADTAAKKFLPQPQFERIVRRVDEIKARVTPDVPSTVKAELRPYQRDGFHFLAYLSANNFGGILADDMGLGKTLQALAWLEWLRSNVPPASRRGETADGSADGKTRQDAGDTLPALVVCPKSVTDNWRAEAERFAPGLRVKLWGANELKGFLKGLGTADLHVINYNQLRSLGEAVEPVRWLAVILDEGQYIKNPSSLTAMIARSLRAQHRLVLSGTPIENRLMDLWSLMSFAMPGALGSRAQFGKIFDSKEDPFARRRLSARVRPFLLRRTKSQVAKDLPERTEEDLFCEIEGEQKTLYRAELKRAQQLLLHVTTQKQLAQERFNVLTSLLRLRQICCHPKLVKPDSRGESAKVESLMDQLEPLMEEGHKVLIFSQFVEMLDILREAITERGWPLFYLAGHTENRGELVRDFQSAEGAAAFLISLKAGGFGLNLTAASYVVLFDPWWNPAVENQAIDRTHRIGQTRNVIAYRLLIKDSIEEKIRALQKTKSALADDVLGEEKFSQSLTLDELRFLFSDEVPPHPLRQLPPRSDHS